MRRVGTTQLCCALLALARVVDGAYMAPAIASRRAAVAERTTSSVQMQGGPCLIKVRSDAPFGGKCATSMLTAF